MMSIVARLGVMPQQSDCFPALVRAWAQLGYLAAEDLSLGSGYHCIIGSWHKDAYDSWLYHSLGRERVHVYM